MSAEDKKWQAYTERIERHRAALAKKFKHKDESVPKQFIYRPHPNDNAL